MNLDIVVGAQYGSEAKGHCVQQLATLRVNEGKSVQVIRVAGPNAGHTGYDSQGRKWALRQVPVAAVVDGPVDLIIAPGSEIDPPVLLDEIDQLFRAGLLRNKRVQVSAEATVITDEHKRAENSDALVDRVGSTGKGIGAARAARLMRRADRVIDRPELMQELINREIQITPTGKGFDHERAAQAIIIEGTQGYSLGLHAGFYPQCTSSDTRAIDFLAMAGLSPWSLPRHHLRVWAVARVYPIRVAGNSGPLKDETSWEELGLSPEHTTVTQKVRRVGMSDWNMVRAAVDANGGIGNVVLALFMLDQKFPEAEGVTQFDELPSEAKDFVWEVQGSVGTMVSMVGTSPNTVIWR